ncbi:uncharacterized protein LOC141718370 [Apium graveolens]|uniref:uncharacterized protein LOC141718370 n=1 Tax=Apium graveolens TaxID=4045 RepID=UPI003D7AA75F
MEHDNYVMECIPIYKAAIEGDWETAEGIFKKEKKDLNGYITYYKETTLQIAVGTNSCHHFVEQLVERIMEVGGPEMLQTANCLGDHALHYAAKAGNTTAARLLVEKDPELTQIPNPSGHTALMVAPWYGQRETLCYLLEVTKDEAGERGTSPYQGKHGADVLALTIVAEFYDVALYLVKQYPDLVMEKSCISSMTGLQTLAAKPNTFPSGSRLGFWQRIIYSWVPVNRERALESPIARPTQVITAENQNEVSHIQQMHDNKVKHIQAEELVKQMCAIVIKKADHAIAWDVMGSAISTAVKYGIHELIEQCIYHYPGLVWYNHVFLGAIKQRQEKVYNLVYQMTRHKVYVTTEIIDGENALHLAAKLAPRNRLSTVTGAALQMQRELEWFKEVEKLVEPSYKEALNNERKTPGMVFTIEHKELLIEARQWMKDTSSSATVVAALIVTMAFAAIFTAPGGNRDDGQPLFVNESVFMLFAISDAIALFSSSTSVLVFLSVLNSRFAEEDFLYALPKRLTIGLISLFVSLASTMVAFSATLALVLRDKIQWIAAPVTLLAGVPVTLFLLLQYPLLVELVRSTYGRGIFYKQNNLLLH